MCSLLIIWQTKSRLDVISLATHIGNKINFKLFLFLHSFFISVSLYHHTNINLVTSHTQFIINDVFHQMSLFNLPKSQSSISQPHILKIIFEWGSNVFSAFHIISINFIDYECILQMVNICSYGIKANIRMDNTLKSCFYF